MSTRERGGERAVHVRDDLGLYVLGALGTDECAVIEAHLRRCDPCREAHEYINVLPNLLATQSEEDVRLLPGDL
jgi:predicted anti-sigma-YlaC factor YlaD